MEENRDVPIWVAALQRGEDVETNSRRIFKTYYGWVRGFFTRRRIPIERAEELAQEALFLALRRIGSFRADSSFDSWFFAIAANLLRNEHRWLSQSKRNAPEVSIESPGADAEPPLELADRAASPEQEALQGERMRMLARAISNLPGRPRDCIKLRLAGHDYADIAEILKLSPSTARFHVFSARQRLQEELGSELSEWVD